jgi:uncharacterized membrane protein
VAVAARVRGAAQSHPWRATRGSLPSDAAFLGMFGLSKLGGGGLVGVMGQQQLASVETVDPYWPEEAIHCLQIIHTVVPIILSTIQNKLCLAIIELFTE